MASSTTAPSPPKCPRCSRFIEGVATTDTPSGTTANSLFYSILSQQDHHDSQSRSRSQSHSRNNSNSSTSSTNLLHPGPSGPPAPFPNLTSEPLPLPQNASYVRNPNSISQPDLNYAMQQPRALSRISQNERERGRRSSAESPVRQEQEQKRESRSEKLLGRFRALTLGNRGKDVRVEPVYPVTERMVLD